MTQKSKRVCVLGLGYIGLPTASILATNGFEVIGVDIAPGVVETINRGEVHIEEPGLRTLVAAACTGGRLRAQQTPCSADVFIIAVPTPLSSTKGADLSHVTAAMHSILPHLQPGNLVILESTSPPGTCRDLLAPMIESAGFRVGTDVFLAHCPERVLPGKILKELIENDRIIGGWNPQSAEIAGEIYATFVEGDIVLTDATTAEMVKILENTYRDVNIALANEAAVLCENIGVNFWEVVTLANRHPRVHLHAAGPGVGGHCIPVDPWFLVEKCPEEARLIRTARDRNDSMPQRVARETLALLSNVGGTTVAAFGIAFKGNVDDLRESPALTVIHLLRTQGIEVCIFDPHIPKHSTATNALDAVREADCLLILTDHDAFKELDPKALGPVMRRRIVYDTRHILEAEIWRAAGFYVRVLGIPSDSLTVD
jgi:UDP-N-acetyl-D-mannosaminuronic acid dehydrogenase